jgi:DNA-binding NarL/FixJ family response regulator
MLLAMELEALLEEAGCQVVGSSPDVRRGLEAIAEKRPEVVLLDMNLNGESSAPIAAALQQEDIPCLVVTGYSGSPSGESIFRDAAIVKKPFDEAHLLLTLSKLVA